jgi:hypothetical protein
VAEILRRKLNLAVLAGLYLGFVVGLGGFFGLQLLGLWLIPIVSDMPDV